MKHRAPKVAPPRHHNLERLEWYPLEPVHWDMGLMSHTMPIQKIQVDAPYPKTDPGPTAADAGSTKSSDRNLALNSLALMLSTVITGGLGLLFWAAAGRLYPVAEVGSASAVITSAVMLSTLSNLSLGSMCESSVDI